MKNLASLKRLYNELMQSYYEIVHAYGLNPIPPELSAKATEYMDSAQDLRKKYPDVDTRVPDKSSNVVGVRFFNKTI